ncbi:sulfotransferase family 2 domain-containing protein [Roseisalinus antarcticus]|uniref:Sulfotransferase family protein n=1 Tax=Roseisalinus antarcticus TaxID=254357 RepID=A0A1Y5TQ24_9RHOB|nr:sulfotransferase family 2 domain-containing protein [Roseisalinus antarcticus]SLN69257.1 Sulfotransferase family protein [Roseisalinus antarcticus]
MIVSHSRKIIFFSFPKTGSESVRDMLSEINEEPIHHFKDATPQSPYYSHMSPAEAQAEFEKRGLDYSGYFRFTVTRNPYPRLVSIYEMVMAVDGVEKLKRRIGLRQQGFADWLAATEPSGSGGGGRRHQRWRRFGTWSTAAWIAGRDGEVAVDRVLRLEYLADELPGVLRDLSLPRPETLTHKNRRVTRDWRSYYDDRSRALVAARYGDDLATYGYGFD